MNVENSAALTRRIEELKREKKAVILAHYYTTFRALDEVQQMSVRALTPTVVLT